MGKVATAPFDLVKFPGLGKGWRLVPEEQDADSAALTEVDFGQAEFISGLKDGESVITGEEKLKRLKASGRIRYGVTVFMGLWNDYQSRKENSVLERLYRERRVTWMDFPGDVLLVPGGHRRVLYFYRGGREWSWNSYWLGSDWGASRPSAVSSPVSAVA